MTKKWTPEELAAMSVHKRADIYANACRLAHTPDGAALKKEIEDIGLPFSDDACLTMDDPITIKMHEVTPPRAALPPLPRPRTAYRRWPGSIPCSRSPWA